MAEDLVQPEGEVTPPSIQQEEVFGGINPEGAVTLSDISLEEMFGEVESPLSLDVMFPDDIDYPVAFSFELGGLRDASNLIEDITGNYIENPTPEDIDKVTELVSEEISSAKMQELEDIVRTSDDVEAISKAMQEYVQFENSGEITQADVQSQAVIKRLGLDKDSAKRVRAVINYNLTIAEELDKRAQAVWEEADWVDIALDLGHVAFPVVGFFDYEIDKYSDGLAENVEKLVQAGNLKEANAIIDGIVDSLNKTQGAIISNNNALNTMSSLTDLANEFRNGASGYINGTGTPVERTRYLETGVFLPLEVSGVKGLAKGISTILKKVLPRNLDAELQAVKLLDPNVNGKEYKIYKDVEAPAVDKVTPPVNAKEQALKAKAESRLQPSEIKEAKKEIKVLELEVKAKQREIESLPKMKPAAKKRAKASKEKELAEIEAKLDNAKARLSTDKEAQDAWKELVKLKARGGKPQPSAPLLRRNNSRADNVGSINKLEITREMQTKSLKTLAEEHGLSIEDVVDRLIPTMTREGKGLPDTKPTLAVMNELLMASKEPIEMGIARAIKMQRDLGKSVKVNTSDIRIVDNDMDNSIGDFIMSITDAKGSKFKTIEEAQKVADNLFGIESKIAEATDGFSVEVTVPHIFDATMDTSSVGGKSRALLSGYGTHLVDPLRRLGKDMIGAAQVLSDTNASLVYKLTKRFEEAVTKHWSIDYQRKVALALQEMQELGDEGVLLTRQDLNKIDGMTGTKKELDEIWESISEIKAISDEMYRITDRNYKLELEAGGWKRLDTSDEEFNFVREITKADLQGKKGSKTLGKFENEGKITKQELVLDMNTGAKKAFGDLEDQSQVVIVMEHVADEAGNAYRLIIPKGGKPSVKPLPKVNMLKKREGYIPRMYKDVGYRVVTTETKMVGGIEQKYDVVTHLVKTKEEALKIAQENADKGIVSSVSSSRETKNKNMIFADGSSSYGYGSVHTKARGDKVMGAEGNPAELLDPLTAISKRLNTVQKELNHPVISGLKARYRATFKHNLKKGGKWYELDTEKASWMTQNQADTFKKYIDRMEGIQNANTFSTADMVVSHIVQKAGLDIGDKTPIASASRFFKSVATNLYITGRPLFQIPTNFMQIASVVRRYPAEATSIATKGIIHGVFAMANKLGKSTDNIPFLAKSLGVTEREYKDIIDYVFHRSGLIDGTAFTDDIMGMNADLSLATSKAQLAKKAVIAPFKGAKDVSMFAQEGALKLVNASAFWAELQHDIWKAKKADKAWKWDSKTAERIHLRSRQLTNTQNKVNKFEHQNEGLLSHTFQFMQHIQKMFLDDVLDPALKMTTGKTIGEASVNAETRAVATQVTMFNLAMFGGAGLIGEQFTRDVYTDTGKKYPELMTSDETHWVLLRHVLQGGFYNDLISGLPSRLNPAAMLDALTMFFDKSLYETIFGASEAASLGVLEGAYNVGLLTTNPVMDTKEKVFNSAMEISRVLAGVKDAERAYVAYNMGTLPYFDTLSGNLNISQKESLYTLFSVTPESALQYYHQSKQVKDAKKKPLWTDTQTRINELFIKAMNRELLDLKTSGVDLNPTMLRDIRLKYVEMAKASHGNNSYNWDKVEDDFRRMMLTPDTEHYESYVRPYINEYSNYQESYDNLVFLSNQTDDPRFKEFIKIYIEDLEMKRSKEELGIE